MARKIIHQLVDDIDNTALEPGEGETVLFSLDGKGYEIDLTSEHAAELRAALEPYISAGRRVAAANSGSAPRSSSSSAGRRRTGQVDYAPVRAWAKENGHKISERGRIPASVLEAYEAAH